MVTQKQNHRPSRVAMSQLTTLLICVNVVVNPTWAARNQADSDKSSGENQSEAIPLPSHMPETIRVSVEKVIVVPGTSPGKRSVTGTYEKETAGLLGGMDQGSRVGTVSRDVGPVPVSFGIPGLAIPGAIIGGLTGATKRQIQDFRDALAEDLTDAANQPLRNEALALDVFWGIQKLPDLESRLFAPTTAIPEDTDAILYVSLNDLTIDVQGKEAIITSSAKATLHSRVEGKDLYEQVIQYQNKDTLSNWTKDDNAAWRDYANYARHYLGREVSAEVFDRVRLNHELMPKASGNVSRVKKNAWRGVTKSLMPTLAWELTLKGGDTYGAWKDKIQESDIRYDVEVYDRHRLVYTQEQVQGTSYTLAEELQACQTYRWSVRPSYHVDGDIRFGEWMRVRSETEPDPDAPYGIVGRKVSESPAYIQDFASLEIKCK